MAITGKFQADFSSFSDAVQKAQVELRGFEGNASKVETALSRMTDNFSGRKVIQDATLMAQAIENVGGLTKLTAKELETAGAKAAEAATQFRKWGQDVPKNVQAIADTVKTAEKATSDWTSQLNSLAGAFGVTLSVAGIVGFAQELLRTGDELVKVADRTGLTTEEVQKLQFIAGQSGNTIDELTNAIGKLQKGLTLGDTGATAAVKQLGLNLEQLKTESPYQQMGDIATAIAKIEDPAQRATLAVQLFGKGGAEILPTLISNFQALGESAPVMSDKTVRALDAAGDALNKFGQTIKVIAAESYNFAGQIFDRLTASAYKVASSLLNFTAGFLEIEKHIPGVTTAFQKLGISTEGLREQARQLSDTGTLLVSHLGDQEVAIRKNVAAVGEFEPKVEKATKAVKEHAAEVIGLGEGEKTLQGVLKLQQEELQRYYERLEQIIPATKDWNSLLAITPGEIIETTKALVDWNSVGEKVALETLPGMVTGNGIAGFSFTDLATRVGQVGSVLNGVQGEWADFAKIGINAIQGVASALAKGDIFGAILAGATAAVAVVTKLWGKLRDLFGGPSADELAAREEFAKSFDSANDAIAILSKKLADAGINGEDARVLIQALFDATHQSAKAVDDAMQAINDRIASTNQAVQNTTDSFNKLGQAINNLPAGPTSNYEPVAPGQSFAFGGVVKPFPSGRSAGRVTAHVGEMILTPQQQALLLRGASSGAPTTLVVQSVLDGRVIAESTTTYQNQRDQLRRKVRAA